jgi:hypothetical protein
VRELIVLGQAFRALLQEGLLYLIVEVSAKSWSEDDLVFLRRLLMSSEMLEHLDEIYHAHLSQLMVAKTVKCLY